MKVVAVFITLIITGCSLAQSESYFLSPKRGYDNVVEVEENRAVVYGFMPISSNEMHYFYFSKLYVIDTLQKEPSGDFYGINGKLLRNDNRLFLWVSEGEGKRPKKMEMIPDSSAYVNENMNRNYFHYVLDSMERFTAATYPNFRHFTDETWDEISQRVTTTHHNDFQREMQPFLKHLSDSIFEAHAQFTAISDSLLNNTSQTTAEEVQHVLSQLPSLSDYGSTYSKNVLDNIAIGRPELYLEVVESLPDQRNEVLSHMSKEAYKSIRTYETTHSMKKEIIRFHRKQTTTEIAAFTAYLLMDSGFIIGLVNMIAL